MSDQVEINSNIIKHDKNKKTKVLAMPISIDFRHIDKVAQSAEVLAKAEELQKIFDGQIIGLGVDRLDYSKGIIEKFEGLELFLEQNPEYIKKLSFIQIAVPTRSDVPEYAKLKRKVDETVGRINGKFSKEGWSPIHYIYSNLKPQDIIAYYKCADFIIVSALRDGLNLVAKEYVASRSNNSGALILSEFTGAAEEIPHKFLINPYDTNSIATAIKRTLESDEKQKILQMAELRSYVKENDIFHWLDAFLRELC
jgi:trehalose-6-phosphate synthase